MCLFFLLSSPHRLSSVSVVFDFNASLNDAAPVSPIRSPVYARRKGKSELLIDAFCVSSFFLSSLFRLSFVSVVFVFSASLNDVAPMSPMSLSVDKTRKERVSLFIDVFCVSSFFLSSQPRLSAAMVVFDFNASLNDVAPLSLI